MIRGDVEARISLSEDYNQCEMTWTFSADSRASFLRDAAKLWDWFMNDPIPSIDKFTKNLEVEETEDGVE